MYLDQRIAKKTRVLTGGDDPRRWLEVVRFAEEYKLYFGMNLGSVERLCFLSPEPLIRLFLIDFEIAVA
jgi:hypothetical protein